MLLFISSLSHVIFVFLCVCVCIVGVYVDMYVATPVELQSFFKQVFFIEHVESIEE